MIREQFSRLARRLGRRHRAARIRTDSPVQFAFGGSGTTRDVSATGVFFETDGAYDVDSTIHFVIEFRSPTGPMKMDCSGTIIRVEKHDGKVGVAVKLSAQRLQPVA